MPITDDPSSRHTLPSVCRLSMLPRPAHCRGLAAALAMCCLAWNALGASPRTLTLLSFWCSFKAELSLAQPLAPVAASLRLQLLRSPTVDGLAAPSAIDGLCADVVPPPPRGCAAPCA